MPSKILDNFEKPNNVISCCHIVLKVSISRDNYSLHIFVQTLSHKNRI